MTKKHSTQWCKKQLIGVGGGTAMVTGENVDHVSAATDVTRPTDFRQQFFFAPDYCICSLLFYTMVLFSFCGTGCSNKLFFWGEKNKLMAQNW